MVWLAIAVGGALGSVARHGVNVLIHDRWPLLRFPLATLIVNVAGCLIIGVLAGLVMAERIELRFYWREFLLVGVLGGFTTFSSFSLETLELARGATLAAAGLNVALSLTLCLFGAWLGFATAALLNR